MYSIVNYTCILCYILYKLQNLSRGFVLEIHAMFFSKQ